MAESIELVNLLKIFENVSPEQKELFRNLLYFMKFYDKNHIWYMNRILEEREKSDNSLFFIPVLLKVHLNKENKISHKITKNKKKE